MTQLAFNDAGFAIYVAANEAIDHARKDGQKNGKHSPESWEEETILEQIEHANNHCYNAYTQIVEDNCDPELVEMEHALCRLAIAIALYKKENK